MPENYQCRRCGACCVYFDIRADPPAASDVLFKRAGEVCENLEYDFTTFTATCKIHDGEIPKMCREFTCEELNPGRHLQLRIVELEMPRILRRNLPQKV